jgi:hypothetical protein
VRAAVEAAGAKLLCPSPYGPDFTPAETALAKRKAPLCRVAARTVNEPWSAIGCPVETSTPDGCANHFAAAGYEPGSMETALMTAPNRRSLRLRPPSASRSAAG